MGTDDTRFKKLYQSSVKYYQVSLSSVEIACVHSVPLTSSSFSKLYVAYVNYDN